MARLLDRIQGHRETLDTLLQSAARDRLASTLLFSGPSGIGKRLAAMALAQTLVCERKEEKACGECGPCLRMEKGQSESLLMIEPDGAQIKIEQARDVLQFVSLQKLGRARVVIFDQAHTMNPQAANSLLKSLEEPPAGTYFILITPLAASMLATIRSRSQLVRFRPLTDQELAKILGEGADPWIIESAQGSVEKAQGLMEDREDFLQIEDAVLGFLRAAATHFPAREVTHLKEMMKERSAQSFVALLIQSAVRDGMRLQAGLQPMRPQKWQGLATAASAMSPQSLDTLAESALAMEHEMARNIDRGLLLENFALSWRKASTAGMA